MTRALISKTEPQTTNKIQWTGYNLEDIRDFIDNADPLAVEGTNLHYFKPGGVYDTLAILDWLYK